MATEENRGAHVQVQGLARRFGRRWALARIEAEIRPGAGLLLLGPNGSGKTTLLRCLSTALRPHAGSVLLDGQDLWTDRARLRGHIATLSHQHRIYEDLSARDNLVVWARLAGVPLDPAERLDAVGLPNRPSPVRTFSAGMRRRLALAVALLVPPRLLLLDEPLSSLDAAGRELVLSHVRRLRGEGVTVVASTHYPRLLADLCDDVLELDAGRVVYHGPRGEPT